jgi:hypothetical protein
MSYLRVDLKNFDFHISTPKNVALKKGDWLKDGGKRMGREKKRRGKGTS